MARLTPERYSFLGDGAKLVVVREKNEGDRETVMVNGNLHPWHRELVVEHRNFTAEFQMAPTIRSTHSYGPAARAAARSLANSLSIYSRRLHEFDAMSLTARSEPTDVKKEKMFPLLDKRLPAEIRLQIYDWILVSRSPDGAREIAIEVADHHKFKDAMRELGLEFKVYGHIDQKDGLKYELDPDCKIPWGFMRAPWNLPLNINVSLLRTCKQVYNEAVSTLYSKNIFHTSDPATFTLFLQKLKIEHVTRIEHVTLLNQPSWYKPAYDLPGRWMALLEFLQRKPGGLKKLAFEWQMMAISPSYTFTDKDPDIRRFASGWGFDLPLLSALSALKNLHTLEIAGYYAPSFPAYLRQTARPRSITIIQGDKRGSPSFYKHGDKPRAFMDFTATLPQELQARLFEMFQEASKRVDPWTYREGWGVRPNEECRHNPRVFFVEERRGREGDGLGGVNEESGMVKSKSQGEGDANVDTGAKEASSVEEAEDTGSV